MLSSSLQVFFYPVNDTIFFITTTSKTAPISNMKHFKHNTELFPAPINFRNKLDNIQNKVTNLNFNLNFSAKSYIRSYHFPPNIDIPFTFQWNHPSNLAFNINKVQWKPNALIKATREPRVN